MDTATAAVTETKPAVDPLDSPAVAAHKAKKAAAKAKKASAKKAKAGKKPAKKSKKAQAKKAAKAKVKKAAKKVAKKAKATKATKRKRVGPHVTFKRDLKLKAKLVKLLKTPRTVRELAKLMKVGKTMGQQYIVSLKAAGVKLKTGNERQGKRGPKALTYQVA